MERMEAEAGILTFHCSDNFGAMLQAYALKTYLCGNGIRTDVIRYAPPYMTGRHWLFPYLPDTWQRGFLTGVWSMLGSFKVHLGMGRDFFLRRANMRRFREEYLIDRRQPKCLSARRLKRLPYSYYIVGSDQIWNPDITCGLRGAYFGAFENGKKKKVISYAASFGGSSLSGQYDEEFSRLIQYVDAVSVREEEAIPYVKRFLEKEVTAVLDPVFFLDKEAWQKVEKTPVDGGYIFVYITEKNQKLTDYCLKLSRDTKLPVIEVSAGRLTTGAGFSVDITAGPAEFLGYIHHADYVVSNSFHAIALSILYQKRFLAFVHSNRGARIRNILQLHGLEDRLCETGEDTEIDAFVDWEEVRSRTKENVKSSGDFLIRNILE